MDSSRRRTPPVDRVAEIRADIVSARARTAERLEALRFKADLPARLGDSVGNAVLIFTEHVLDRVTSAKEDEATEQHPGPIPASNESAVPREAGQPSGPASHGEPSV